MPENGRDLRPCETVLIVEDEPVIAITLAAYLEHLGIDDTGKANRLSEARDSLAERNYDLVILDMNLAGQSAAPLALELVEQGQPIIVSTGVHRDDLPLPLHSVPVLVKPYSFVALANALTACGFET